MAKKMGMGNIAFMVGFFGALLLALLSFFGINIAPEIATVILVIAGIVIGLMNIKPKEANTAMLIALVLGLGAWGISSLPYVAGFFETLLQYWTTVFLPAGVTVAVMSAMRVGK